MEVLDDDAVRRVVENGLEEALILGEVVQRVGETAICCLQLVPRALERRDVACYRADAANEIRLRIADLKCLDPYRDLGVGDPMTKRRLALPVSILDGLLLDDVDGEGPKAWREILREGRRIHREVRWKADHLPAARVDVQWRSAFVGVGDEVRGV